METLNKKKSKNTKRAKVLVKMKLMFEVYT